MRKTLIAVLFVLATARSEDEAEERWLLGRYPKVKTTNGFVKGVLEESCRAGKQFAAFRGIPYAEPPLEELRFRDPLPSKNWRGTWDATYDRPSCLQTGMEGFVFPSKSGYSEDCLYLNVYTPNVRYLKYGLGPRKAVMVFIHPGAFNMGSGSDSFFAPDFLLDQDVVVVSFNYRLGALGFLSFQNEVVPGNAGLKDQVLVLKWVKNNIKNFGGDPSRITIFGESAGSASVSFHILSQSSKGLFNNAIMESGSALSRWAYSPPDLALKKAHILARHVGCHQTDLDELLACMQQVSAEKITESQQGALTIQEVLSVRVIAFHPTTEPDVAGAFLTGAPLDLLYSKNFTEVPTIIGLNSNEGLLLYPSLEKYDPSGILAGIVGLDLSRFAPTDLHVKPFTRAAARAHELISKFYFDSKLISKAQTWKLLELVTDVMFTLPIQVNAIMLSGSSAPVYNYYFTYEGGYNVLKSMMKIPDAPGVCHGDEMGYLFYIPHAHFHCADRNTSADPMDEIMIDRMTKMWTNFAKTGQPTPTVEPEIGVKWEPFTLDNRTYLDIGRDLVPHINGPKVKSMMFWNYLIREMIRMQDTRAERNNEGILGGLFNLLNL